MIFNRERATCFGRGFTSTGPNPSDKGLLENIKNWIVRAAVPSGSTVPGSVGGPNWHTSLISDHSGDAVDPYIIAATHSGAVMSGDPNAFNNGPYKVFKIGMIDTDVGKIYANGYLSWDGSNPYGLFFTGTIETGDDTAFQYDLRGGPELICISARKSTTWTTVSWGDWLGDTDFVEGPALFDKTNSSLVDGGTQVVTLTTPGAAANFTKDKYYYIYDFNGRQEVNYTRITNVNTGANQLTVESIDTVDNAGFPVGSVICSYRHRQYLWQTNIPSNAYRNVIPYCSYKTTNSLPGAGTFNVNKIRASIGVNSNVLLVNAPNDEQKYVSNPGWVCESANGLKNTTDMNRAYGTLVGQYFSSTAGMAQMTDKRTIDLGGGPEDYIYMAKANIVSLSINISILAPDFDSDT